MPGMVDGFIVELLGREKNDSPFVNTSTAAAAGGAAAGALRAEV